MAVGPFTTRGKNIMSMQVSGNNQPGTGVAALGNFPPGTRVFVFRGGAATWFGTQLLGMAITIFTLGICYPFAVVLVERWRAKNTFLLGRPLRFVGTGWGIFGLWIKWFLLILITLGIYSFWVYPRLTVWKIENTVLD
ncbi:hypothetical protein GCM10017711_03660 [Paeniglutamicibacter sulfureus]